MHRSICYIAVVALLSLIPLQIRAQVATGTPPFAAFGGGPDVINLGNLNTHFDVPVMNKPGRGTNFTYDITYDSSLWYPVTTNGTITWTPIRNWGWINVISGAGVVGYISYNQTTLGYCFSYGGQQVFFYKFTNFVYHDFSGILHPLPGQIISENNYYPPSELEPPCSFPNPNYSAGGIATDGSGFQYLVSTTYQTASYITSGTVWTPAGTALTPALGGSSGTETLEDRNGNEITSNGSGKFYDTLSSSVPTLTISGSGTAASPTVLTYTPANTSSSKCASTNTAGVACYTVNYTNYTVATNFGVSGMHEYKSPTVEPLVSSIVIPDGSEYVFTYEPTPSVPASGACTPYSGTTCVTARILSVTLPTGGKITYAYSGGNNGVFSDGSTAALQRTTPDGVWKYVRTTGTGAASATLITAPQLSYDSAANQTIVQFQGIYPTQMDIYEGAAPSFTTLPISEASLQTSNLLRETQSCYNASAKPCTNTAITLPIAQLTYTAYVAGSGKLASQHTDKYNLYGQRTESDDYDFSANPPGTLLQQTTINYDVSLGAYLTAFTQTVEVLNAAGTIQSRQDTAYDGAALTCVTGAPQHDNTNYSCSATARGNATSVTTYTNPSAPSGGVTKNFTYDSTGNLLTAQLNCCELKTWVYSTATGYAYADSITSGPSSPQLKTTYTYDLNTGLPLTATDPNGLETTLTYDNLGRPSTSTVGSNPPTTYTYTDSGTAWTVLACAPVQGTNTACQKTIEDNQGRTTTTQLLDASSNLYSANDTAYDPLGRAYKVSNPYTTSASYWTQTNFDALGRTVKTILQDGSTSTSSYTDNTVTATDPAGKQREGVSDALGRLTSVFEPDPSNGSLTLQTSYAYNAFNQLTQVTQGSSQTRTYVYDALGRLTSATTPEAGAVCYGTLSGGSCQPNGYDMWNNLLYRTDARGVVTNYIYDSLNRLVGVAYPTVPNGVATMPNVCKANGATSNNANICITYGTSTTSYNNGLPLTMTDPSGSESYTYNSLEQLTQLQKIVGSTTYATGYSYNYAGELTQLLYPAGGTAINNYDPIGRLCAVGENGSTCTGGVTFATGFTYNPAQEVTGFTYQNGVIASFGFSPDRLQLSSLSYKNGSSTLFGLSYAHGASGSNDGLISTITDSVDNGRTVSYTYDSLQRLSTAVTSGSTNYPAWGLKWAYDQFGNRTNQMQTAGSPPTNSVAVNATTNQLTGGLFTYDASGNMTNDGLNSLVYDGENRTTSATSGSSSGAYVYDGKGLRVKKCVPNCTSPTTSTVYIFSGPKVIAEYDNGAAPSAPTRQYVYAGAALIAKFDSVGNHYYHQDHLSNRLQTDSNGNVTEQFGTYPYGESWYNTTSDKLFFTTYERDLESENDYAVFRSFINRFGRFSTPDPVSGVLSNPQSFNRYAYVLNDPCNLVDPLGLNPCLLNIKFTSSNGKTLSNSDVAAIASRINTILAGGASPSDAAVQVQPSDSGDADYTLNYTNNDQQLRLAVYMQLPLTLGGTPGSGTAGKIYADAVQFAVWSEGPVLLSALGSVGAHELIHLAVPGPSGQDQPFSILATNIMMLDSAPPAMNNDALFNPDSALWKLTPDQLAALVKDCNNRQKKKKRSGSGGGGGADLGTGGGSAGGGCGLWEWVWDSEDAGTGHSNCLFPY